MLKEFISYEFVIIAYLLPGIVILIIKLIYKIIHSVHLNWRTIIIWIAFPSMVGIIHLGILAIHSVNAFHYLLLPFTAIIWTFIYILAIMRCKGIFHLTLLEKVILVAQIFIFLTYPIDLVNGIWSHVNEDWERKACTKIIKQGNTGDIVATNGFPPCYVLRCPSLLKEKVRSINELGGSTGIVLQYLLQKALHDSSKCVKPLIINVEDYFWQGTKYEGRWILINKSAVIRKKPDWVLLERVSDWTINKRILYDATFQEFINLLLETKYILVMRVEIPKSIFPWGKWRNKWFDRCMYLFKATIEFTKESSR